MKIKYKQKFNWNKLWTMLGICLIIGFFAIGYFVTSFHMNRSLGVLYSLFITGFSSAILGWILTSLIERQMKWTRKVKDSPKKWIFRKIRIKENQK